MEKEAIGPIIIISAILTIVGVFVIAYLVHFNKRKARLIEENNSMKEEFQHQLLQSQIEVQEQTFQQIGKELHDNVGQLLSTSRMLLGLTERSLRNPPDTLLTANATLAQAINELRSLSKSLDKEWLEQFNFSENLQTEIARIDAGDKVKAFYEQRDEIILKPEEQIILFRIVQEAIQNAIKHGLPDQIKIIAEKQENIFCIRVIDNGSSFENTEQSKGMGLNNMKHRTQLLGGIINWEKNPEGGTIVVISLSLKEESE